MDRKVTRRILIADDHRLMAEACAKMLQPEYEIVGVVTDGRSLARTAIELKPDAVIVEVSMPLLNGLDAAEQVKRKLPSTKIVFLTTNSDPNLASEAFRRGASGYILKHSGAEEFISAIRRIMNGQSYLSPLIARETMTYLLHRRHASHQRNISGRQSEILQLLAEGRTMKEVADILDITPGTVAFHKYNMMEKLGITSTAGLLLYALKNQIIPAQKSA
jgi:DNA-binding NarL/FixJ family response regulator